MKTKLITALQWLFNTTNHQVIGGVLAGLVVLAVGLHSWSVFSIVPVILAGLLICYSIGDFVMSAMKGKHAAESKAMNRTSEAKSPQLKVEVAALLLPTVSQSPVEPFAVQSHINVLTIPANSRSKGPSLTFPATGVALGTSDIAYFGTVNDLSNVLIPKMELTTFSSAALGKATLSSANTLLGGSSVGLTIGGILNKPELTCAANLNLVNHDMMGIGKITTTSPLLATNRQQVTVAGTLVNEAWTATKPTSQFTAIGGLYPSSHDRYCGLTVARNL